MNRKHFLLIFYFVMLALNAKGQFLDKVFGIKYHKGSVILNNGDTLRGKIMFNNDYSNYNTLIFRDTITNKNTNYKPREVKSFSLDSLIFYRKILNNQWVFECLLLNGDLKVYLYRYYMSTGYTSGTETSYIYEKSNGQYLMISTYITYPFKKRVSEFFSDYPELSEKIYNKTYKFNDLFLIAEEYNIWLKNKKSNK